MRPRELALAVTGYALLAVLLTWPLASRLTTALPDYPWIADFDIFNNMWSLWWMRKALLEDGLSWFFTGWLLHPDGVTLTHTSLSPLSGLAALPVMTAVPGLRGVTAAYNLHVIESFFLAGLGMYLLARRQVSWQAASLAGLAFTAAPYHFHSIRHIDLISIHWFPFFFLFLERVLEHRRIADKMVLGLVGAGVHASCGTYAVFVPLATALYLVARSFREGGRWLALAVADLSLAGAITLVAAYPVWTATLADSWYVRFETPILSEVIMFSPGLEELVTPRTSVYLGLVLMLGAIGGWRRTHHREAWVALLIGSLVLVPGPELKLGESGTGWTLPYRFLFDHVGIFSQSRFTARFIVITYLAACVLAAHGFQRLLEKASSPRLALALLGAVLFLDFRGTPVPTFAPVVPEGYQVVKKKPVSIPVFEHPFGYRSNRFWMFHQIEHGHPIFQGHLARRPLEAYMTESVNFMQDIPEMLLCLHPGFFEPSPPHPRVLEHLRRRYRWTKLHEDPEMQVHRLELLPGM